MTGSAEMLRPSGTQVSEMVPPHSETRQSRALAPNLNDQLAPHGMIGVETPNENLSLNYFLPMRGFVVENLVLCALSHWTLREANDSV